MKRIDYKKVEKWWLILIIIFYLLYNFPGYPKYGDSKGALWHGILTLIPLWIIVYAGFFMLLRIRRLKDYKDDVINKSKKDGE